MLSHVTSNAFVYICGSLLPPLIASPTPLLSTLDPSSIVLELPASQIQNNPLRSSQHYQFHSWRSAAPRACAVLAPNPLPAPRSVCPGNARHETSARRHCSYSGYELTRHEGYRPRSWLLKQTSDTDLRPLKNATRL